ncbi:MAG: Spy/CpxP family protein refolding chaperone [Proteobacteria bacterium]|nr:Spy/CpxP family protein refolding chaperone [Pseudomonadota bacterium]
MKTNANRWNRSAGRLLATGLVVALAGSMVLTAEAAPDGPRHHGGGPGAGAMMMGPMLSPRMLDEVNATTEQRTQIRQIFDAARTDLKAQRDSGQALHDQMITLFSQPTVDANAAEALRQQQLARHDAASKRMMQAMLDVSRVLSADQRTKLAALVKQRQQSMAERMSRRGAAAPK